MKSVTKSINPSSSARSKVIAVLGLLSVLLPVSHTAHAQGDLHDTFVAPVIFQAAGPPQPQSKVRSMPSGLLSATPNNGNNPGPLTTGRREINWDGGNPAIMDTTPPVTPFNIFLNPAAPSSPRQVRVFHRPPLQASSALQ